MTRESHEPPSALMYGLPRAVRMMRVKEHGFYARQLRFHELVGGAWLLLTTLLTIVLMNWSSIGSRENQRR
jgi:hypothetical protein